ncbi:MAG: hypothetical protein HQL32_12915, partial [Planctomycetes bacterium]|nr:hypothetical protein [Planctomycetota bacterium]
MENTVLSQELNVEIAKLEKREPYFCEQILIIALENEGYERVKAVTPDEENVEEKAEQEESETSDVSPESSAPETTSAPVEASAPITASSDTQETAADEGEKKTYDTLELPPKNFPESVLLAYNFALMGFLYAENTHGKRSQEEALVSESMSWQYRRECTTGNRIERIVEDLEKKDLFLKPLFSVYSEQALQSLALKDRNAYESLGLYDICCIGIKYFLVAEERARHDEFKPWMQNMSTYHRDKKSNSDRGGYRG